MSTFAVVYARFSPRPDALESTSIESQLQLCRDHAGRRGMAIRSEHADAAVSGSELEREGLNAALAALRRGDVLLVAAMDRLWRDFEVQIAIMARLKKAGATVESISGESVRFDTPAARVVSGIMGLIYQFQREAGAERTSQMMRASQSRGENMSRKAPYGFSLKLPDGTLIKDGRGLRRSKLGDSALKVLVADPYEQKIIRYMLNLSNRGMRAGEIADLLNAKQLLKRNGKPWNYFAVREQLIKTRTGATPALEATEAELPTIEPEREPQAV